MMVTMIWKAETSINKEIGLEFKRDGWLAGITVPHISRNKIEVVRCCMCINKRQNGCLSVENVPKGR